MKNPSENELLSLASIDRLARVERNRADCWEMVALVDRQRAVGVAGLAKERAAMPLSTFTDQERRAVCLAISSHCARMEWIAHCMGGGASRVLH